MQFNLEKFYGHFWYIFYIVLPKSLEKTTRKLLKLFSIFASVFVSQTQTRSISVALLQC